MEPPNCVGYEVNRMAREFKIRRGLDIPISGVPQQSIVEGPGVRRVAIVGADYLGMKPSLEVAEGDHVKRGQILFADRKRPSVQYTAPASGRVSGIHRGAKRRFLSLSIDVEGDEAVEFPTFVEHNLAQLPAEQVKEQLLTSGLWTALRTRPFSKVPDPDTAPLALFITAMDTNPLAVDPTIVIAPRERDFVAGLQALSTLTEGPTYLCKAPGQPLPGEDLDCLEVATFAGPHPAGLPGTHIHFLAPVNMRRTAWHINYQDVIAVGHLFNSGQLFSERVVSLAGPGAKNPRVLRTVLGANLTDLTAGEMTEDNEFGVRVISGSVLSGRSSQEPEDYLGRYDLAVTLVPEGRHRELLGWAGPGASKYSVKPVFLSAISAAKSAMSPGQRFPMTTSTHGSHRAIVPIGSYERVMPLDIIATPLLKSLAVDDTETAQELGCLELDEEDLALCTFVDPGKHEFGPMLRRNLTTIEVEG